MGEATGNEAEEGLQEQLAAAAREGNSDEVHRLVKMGADPNGLTEGAYDHGAFLDRVTPLMIAAGSPRSNAPTVRALLDAGADPYKLGSGGVTALWYAAGGGTGFPLTSETLSEMAEDHPLRNWGGGDRERLQVLLEAGLSPSESTDNGRTALLEACSAGDLERARLLIERGASVWPEADKGPHIDEDMLRDLPKVLWEEFQSDASGYSSYTVPLFQAAETGNVDLVRFLLDQGFPADFEVDGENALNHAGSLEVSTLLLDRGLESSSGRFGFDSIDDLFEAGRNHAAMAVIARKADPKERQVLVQKKLLSCSGVRMNPEAVRLLLSAGADPNLLDKDYGSPLHYACWQGDGNGGRETSVTEATVRLLLESGADPNQIARGLMPLHEAVSGDWGSPTSVRVLLEYGAVVDALDEQGATPLMAAADRGERECIELLLAAGADPRPAVPIAKRYLKSWQGIAKESTKKVAKFLKKFGLNADAEEHRNHRLETLREAEACLRILEEAATHRR